MADMMQRTPPAGAQGGNAMLQSLSPTNPKELALMGASGKITPDMSVRQYMETMGVDIEGPVTQLVELAKKQAGNANPLNKMQNMSASTALQPGGQPQTRPGVKPMVKAPGQPSPAGLEGLINRMGGK